jgi:hypothetical protein
MSGRKKTQDEQPDLQADEQVTQPEATEGLDEAEARLSTPRASRSRSPRRTRTTTPKQRERRGSRQP